VDHLGSTRAMTNAGGSPCFKADYLPYGAENTPSGFTDSCNTTYKFTGYERDGETGNDYAFARYYNQRLGRFMSGDPLGGDITDPQSLNRYAYVRNNPINFIDPTGLISACTGTDGNMTCVDYPDDPEPTSSDGTGGGIDDGYPWCGAGCGNSRPYGSTMCIYLACSGPPTHNTAPTAQTPTPAAPPPVVEKPQSTGAQANPCPCISQNAANILSQAGNNAASGVNLGLAVTGVGVVVTAGVVAGPVYLVAGQAVGATAEVYVPGGAATLTQIPNFLRGWTATNPATVPPSPGGYLGWASHQALRMIGDALGY
jgi:RHS repeat-associated protein